MWNPFKVKLVEVVAPKQLTLTGDGRKSLETLKDHPGFMFLLNKLRLQRAALEGALISRQYRDIQDVYQIQSGIRWLQWLENQFLLAIQHPTNKTSRDPNQLELEAVQQALDSIEGVGK